MELRVVEHPVELARLRESWLELERRDPPAVIGTWRFIAAWCRHRLAPDRLHVVSLHRGERCAAILPLMVAQRKMGPLTVPTALGLVRNAYVPGVRPLLDPETEEQASERLVDYLAAAGRPWSAVRLNALPTGGAFYRQIVRRSGSGLRASFGPEEGSATIALPESWDELQRAFRRDRRKTLRNKLRLLEERFEVEILRVVEPGRMAAAIEECFAVAGRSWQGREGTSIASSPASRGFYHDLFARFAETGDARVQLIRLDGRAVAFELALRGRETHCALKTGYDESLADYGLGVLVEGAAFRAAVESGDRAIELFHPASPAKRNWGARPQPHARVTLFTRKLSGRLLALAAGAAGR